MNRAKVVNHFLMVPWELLKRKSDASWKSKLAEYLFKTPLLDRRGAETDERSESDEAGWWN